MKREFTTEQLKVLREVNPRLTDGLFNDIVKDLNEDYSIAIFYEDPKCDTSTNRRTHIKL